jgi:hypothetical protein
MSPKARRVLVAAAGVLVAAGVLCQSSTTYSDENGILVVIVASSPYSFPLAGYSPSFWSVVVAFSASQLPLNTYVRLDYWGL